MGTPEQPVSDLAELLRSLVGQAAFVVADQTDETLALAIKNDFFRREAASELFRRYGDPPDPDTLPLLGRMLQRCGVPWDRCFDLVQEVLFSFHRNHFATWDPDKACVGVYLTRAGINKWKESWRKKRVPTEPLDPDCLGIDSSVLEDIVADELQQQLDAARRTLPERERTVLELKDQGLSCEAIALRLNLTVAEVYRATHRGRTLLSGALNVTRPPDRRGRRKKADSANSPPSIEKMAE